MQPFCQDGQIGMAPHSLNSQPMISQPTSHYYENSSDLIKRLELSEDIENDKQCYSMSSKSANYVAMNPSQFNIPAMTNSMENDDDLQCNKVLPLIPFDPTHNASTCGSSRACHDYESLDPIR